MDKEHAQEILGEVEKGYDLIAEKFSETRKHFWRGLEYVRDYTAEGDVVLDYGCGNGRLFSLISESKNIEYYGVDTSQKLIEFAQSRYKDTHIHFSKINPQTRVLPFDDKSFNTIYSIAVFHHFPSKKYQMEMAHELYRLMKSDGYVVVTVWNLWQKKYIKNIFDNWKAKIFGKSKLDWHDCYVRFSDNQGKKFYRFHHAFTKRELRNLFEGVGFKTEKCQIVDGRNIVYVGKK